MKLHQRFHASGLDQRQQATTLARLQTGLRPAICAAARQGANRRGREWQVRCSVAYMCMLCTVQQLSRVRQLEGLADRICIVLGEFLLVLGEFQPLNMCFPRHANAGPLPA
eukprot:1161670-Pelagomonas_calceolata.AAC.6